MTGPIQLLVGLGLLAALCLLAWMLHVFIRTVVPFEAGLPEQPHLSFVQWLRRLVACAAVLLAGLCVPWRSFRRGGLFVAVAATWRAWTPSVERGLGTRDHAGKEEVERK